MMLTEEQAREKWCPMARVMHPTSARNNFAVNRWTFVSPQRTSCIASECMMWRWELVRAGESFADGSKRGERGWCGLAGKPEAP